MSRWLRVAEEDSKDFNEIMVTLETRGISGEDVYDIVHYDVNSGRTQIDSYVRYGDDEDSEYSPSTIFINLPEGLKTHNELIQYLKTNKDNLQEDGGFSTQQAFTPQRALEIFKENLGKGTFNVN